MGVAAAIVGGSLLGLGAAALLSKKQSSGVDYSNMANISYQQAASTVPTMPEAPVAPDADGNEQKSAAMLAAEEEERKRRIAEAEANKTNYTGGLGLTSPASIQRKTLLG